MAPFDIIAAKQAGYEDNEIADFLGQQGTFDVKGARDAGYSDQEIIGHLSGSFEVGTGAAPTLQLPKGISSGTPQQVMGIASASDKKARHEVDYLRENAGNVVQPVPALALAQGVQGAGGKVRQAGEIVGSKTVANWGKDLAESGEAVQRQIREEHPLEQGTWANSIRSGMASTYMQAPFMVSGGALAAAGKKGLGMAAGLAPLGAITGGESYQKYRERGFDVGTASAGSAVDEAIEVGTELLPMKQVLGIATSKAKLGIKQMVGSLVKYGGEEYVGESLATIGQDVTDKILTDPKLSDDERKQRVEDYFTKKNPQTGNVEAWDNLMETLRTTTVQNVLMMGGGAAANRMVGAPAPAASIEPEAALPAPSGPLSAAVNRVEPATPNLPVPVNTMRVTPQGEALAPEQYNPLTATPGMSPQQIEASRRKISGMAGPAQIPVAPQATTDELVLDEAREWAKAQIAQGQTQLLRIKGEPQQDHGRRIIEAYRKSQNTDEVPVASPGEALPGFTIPSALVAGDSAVGKAPTPSVAPITTLPAPKPDQDQATLDAVTDADRDNLLLARARAKEWIPGSRANGPSNKMDLFPWLSNWGKTTPAEVAGSIDAFLNGKKLGSLQKQLVAEAIRGERERVEREAMELPSVDQVDSMDPVNPVDVVNQELLNTAQGYARELGYNLEGWGNEDLADFVRSYEEYKAELSGENSDVKKEQGALAGEAAVAVAGNGASKTVPLEPVRPVDGQPGDSLPVLQPADGANDVDEAAHEAASSPLNDLPEPTSAQIDAGNYKKGHIRLHGLDISIENPRGSVRRGVDPTGKEWETELAHHYGYIKGTVGRDKDHIDVFVGPEQSERVYVIDQLDPKTGRLDEHKVMLGFRSPLDARLGYLANYDETGPGRIGAITETSVTEFKQWLKDGNTKKAFAGEVKDGVPEVQEEGSQRKEEVPDLRAEGEGGVPGGVAGAVNTVFTEDAYQKARKLMLSKLSQLNAGIDPELMNAGFTIAGYHIERGARSFAAYTRAMIEDLGETIRPYLKSFYNGVRDLPGIDHITGEMDDYATVASHKEAPGLDAGSHKPATSPSTVPVNAEGPATAASPAGEKREVQTAAPFRAESTGREKEPEGRLKMSLKETVHSKKGHKLFVVTMDERVERDVYDRLNRDAKRGGKGYSAFRGNGAIPGFQFLERKPAQEFIEKWSGVTATKSEEKAVAVAADDAIVVNEEKSTAKEPADEIRRNVEEPAAARKPERAGAPAQQRDAGRGNAGDSGTVRAAGGGPRQGDDAGPARKPSVPAEGTGDEPRAKRGSGDGGGRPGRVLAQHVNYRITDADNLGKGGAKQKARDNLAAIRLVKTLAQEGRPATTEEQAQLVKYVGWGSSELANGIFEQSGYRTVNGRQTWAPSFFKEGWEDLGRELKDLLTPEEYAAAKKSTMNAHYTPAGIIGGMYRALERMGFTGGRILEPGSGVGHFIGLLPESFLHNSRFTGVELDHTSAAIAKLLYPGHDIRQQGFEKFNVPDGFYDLAIGNPPFADIDITSDPAYAKHKFKIHDFFFAKAIDKVRPGGLLMFVTSKGTMDKANDKARSYLAERADLLGAIRLPQTAFAENAGTETVTDVIFLRKRLPGEARGGESWGSLSEVLTADGPAHVNEYFAAHPEMVLGRHRMNAGGQYGGGKYTVEPLPGDLAEAFQQAVESLPRDLYREGRAESPADRPTAEYDLAPSSIKEGAFFLDGKGNVLSKENGAGVPTERKGKDLEVVRAFIPLRDAVRQVLYVQIKGGDLEGAQRELKKAYDGFVKKFGPVNKEVRITTTRAGKESVSVRTPNFSPFRDDPDAYLVASIERYNAETGNATPGPIFTERTIKPEVIPQIDSITDALHVVMHEEGRVDVARIAAHMGVTEAQAVDALGSTIYHNPQTAQWETDDEYLSGNVKEKLAVAQSAAQADPRYRRNAEALQAVQPEDLPPSRISIGLGSPILTPRHVEAFADEVIGMRIKVSHLKRTGDWSVEKVSGYATASATSDWGTSRRDAADLVDAALNSRQLRLEKIELRDGKEVKVFDADATNAANEKLVKIKERFREWVWENPARSEELARSYNDQYNNTVRRVYGGEHIAKMTFPGMSAAVNPFDHQKRVAWRVVQSGNTYMAHSVGAGKTIGSILAGMELKRLGIKKKPCWVVPNHMLKQFASEFLQLYPAAKIIVADEAQFSKENRNRFMGRVAAENWDGVIITHSAFGKMQVSPEFSARFIEEQIDDLESALMEVESGDRLKRKQIERAKARLEQRLEKVLSVADKDKGVTFEETGIDQLFVDEAHEFRKLDFTTNQTNIKGIDPNGSLMAFDLYVKSRYLESLYPNRSLVLMSGTSITNTIGEIFTIQRFLQEKQLRETGLDNFDAWASTFGDLVTKLEATPAGTYKPVTRFAKFTNLGALSQMWAEVGDFIHAKDLTYIKRPRVRTGGRILVQADQSDLQKGYKRALAARIKAIEARKRPPQKGDDILLSVITDGRHAALDERYIDPTAAVGQENKLEKMVQNVHQIWERTKTQKSTQMIFADLGLPNSEEKRGFSAYKQIRESLVARGIPAEEIAFMQDYKKSDEKIKLFKAMNEGRVRVLIGSSEAMGTGVNAQKKLVALHHLDPDTYLPANIEQREGRIVRQGNENEEVELYAYVTRGSYDETMWQFLETKQRFIDQFLSGDAAVDEATDVDGSADQFAMARAMSSDNPLVLERAGIEADIQRLESLRRAYFDEQQKLRSDVARAEHNLPLHREREVALKKLIETRSDTGGERFAMDLEGDSYDERKRAGEALSEMIVKLMEGGKETEPRKVGELAGLDIVVRSGVTLKIPVVNLVVGKAGTNSSPLFWQGLQEAKGIDPVGLAMKLENLARAFDRELAQVQGDIARNEKVLKDSSERVGRPFEHAEALEGKRSRLNEIENILRAEEKAEGGGGETRFAYGEKGRSVLSDVEFDAVFKRVTAGLSDAERSAWFTVVQTFEELPSTIKVEADKQGSKGGEIHGVFHRGQVYLVRDRFASQNWLEEVILHEWHGHAGLKGMFGKDIASAMVELYDAVGGARLFTIGRKHGINLMKYGQAFARAGYDKETIKALHAEEMLAHLTSVYSKGHIAERIKELVGRIRAWLREHGFLQLAQYGETDIAWMLKRARAYAESGAWRKDGESVFIGYADLMQRLAEKGISEEDLRRALEAVPSFAAGTPEDGSSARSSEVADTSEGDAARYAMGGALERLEPAVEYARKNWRSLINPLDWSRTAKFFDDWNWPVIQAGLGYVLANPHFQAERDPAKRPFVEEGAEREINRMDLMLAFFGYTPGKDERTARQRFIDFFTKWHSGQESTAWETLNQRYAKLDKQQREAINVLAVQGDVNNVRYQSHRGAMMNPKVKASGLTEETFRLYAEVNDHMDKVADLRARWTEEMMEKAGISKERIQDHIAQYRAEVRKVEGWLSRNHGQGEYAVSVYHVVEDLPFVLRDIEDGQQAYLPFYPGNAALAKIEELAKEIGTVTVTGKGAVIVTASKGKKLDAFMTAAEGIIPELGAQRVKVYARYHNIKGVARRHAAEVKRDLKAAMPENFREGENYEVSLRQVDILTEDMYQNMKSDMAMEAGLQKAFDKAFKSGEIDKGELDRLHDGLVQDTAEILLGRAAGRYQIRRAPYLIEGYDTSNLMANYQEYMTSVAGMLSKADYARKQFEHLKKVKVAAKQWAYKYVFDSLRNMGLGDRISGNVRAFVSLWYMGLKPASALINATQVYTLGIAELGKVAKAPAVIIGRAQRDVVSGKLSEDEQKVFDSAVIRQQEAASAMAQITGHNEGSTGKAGKILHGVTGKTMALFQNVEIVNRKTMILAAYRALRSSQVATGIVDEKALHEALRLNNNVNFDQGRHNLPGWARNPAGHTLYALQSFTWNTFNWLYNNLTSGEKRDQVALLRYAGMLMLIGGAAALPGGEELDKLYRKLRGKSLLMEAKEWTRDNGKRYGTLGEMADAFAWHGTAGLGGVNISNSMRLQMPVVSQWIGDATLPEAFAGVYAGLLKKAWFSAMALSHGDVYRAAESAAPEFVAGGMRAWRQYDSGMTTLKGRPVFDENGKPLKYSAGDAALRAAGFQPSEQSRRMEISMLGKELQAHWKDRREDLLIRLRLANEHERGAVRREIILFNYELRKSQAFGLVPVIKAETMRRALTYRPDKKKVRWMRDALGE